jgi:hypothetical protein
LQAEAALVALQNATSVGKAALTAARQTAQKARAEASQLNKELTQAKASQAEAAKLRKSLAKAQEKLAAVNAEVSAQVEPSARLPCRPPLLDPHQEHSANLRSVPVIAPTDFVLLLQLASAKQGTPGAAAKPKDPNYYRRFILEDLAPWKDHGITKVLLPRHMLACAAVFTPCMRWSGHRQVIPFTIRPRHPPAVEGLHLNLAAAHCFNKTLALMREEA